MHNIYMLDSAPLQQIRARKWKQDDHSARDADEQLKMQHSHTVADGGMKCTAHRTSSLRITSDKEGWWWAGSTAIAGKRRAPLLYNFNCFLEHVLHALLGHKRLQILFPTDTKNVRAQMMRTCVVHTASLQFFVCNS